GVVHKIKKRRLSFISGGVRKKDLVVSLDSTAHIPRRISPPPKAAYRRHAKIVSKHYAVIKAEITALCQPTFSRAPRYRAWRGQRSRPAASYRLRRRGPSV